MRSYFALRIDEIYKDVSIKKANPQAISKGKEIYTLMAKEASIDPAEALNSLISKLCRPWDEPDDFFYDLGNDDILAIIEARRHFHLPPLE
jgi:hypothetical protein